MNPSEESDPPNFRPGKAARGGSPRPGTPQLVRRQRKITANWGEIERFLGRIPAALAPSPCCVCLLSERAMRGFNSRFRSKHEPTDVLSFPAGAPHPGENEEYLGDILISVDTAQRNAARFGHRLEDEIKLLVLHGLLHLAGLDHERDNGRMARQERRWAARLGLPSALLNRERLRKPVRRAGWPERTAGKAVRKGTS